MQSADSCARLEEFAREICHRIGHAARHVSADCGNRGACPPSRVDKQAREPPSVALKSKLLCSITPYRASLDKWDVGFQQTKSRTPVPTHYGFSSCLRGSFYPRLQSQRRESRGLS